MAAFNDPNGQVSLVDDDWYRSGSTENSSKGENETYYSNTMDYYQVIPCETNGGEVERSSSFDAAINNLNLDTNPGEGVGLNDTVEDEISPAIQISKTFSLATLGATTCSKGQLSPIHVEKGKQESYKLTNLDTSDLKNEPELDKTNTGSSQSGGAAFQTYRKEIKQPLPTHKRKGTKNRVGCHVIDLEPFSANRANSVKAEYSDACPKTRSFTVEHHHGQPAVNSHIATTGVNMYPTPNRPSFFDDHSYGVEMVPQEAKKCESNLRNTHRGYSCDKSRLPTCEVKFGDTDYTNVEVNSFYLPDGSGGANSQCTYNLDQISVDSVDCEETSNLVVDLNERLPIDSGIFDISMARKNAFTNFSDRQLSAPTQEHVKRTAYPSKERDSNRIENNPTYGGNKESALYRHDRQVSSGSKLYQKNITQEVPFHANCRESTYYDGVMKSMRDPYVADEYGYMYQQSHSSQFLCNRIIPCASWESTAMHKNSMMPMVTDVVDDSGHSAWCSDNFNELFASGDTSDIAHYSQLSAFKDEEETDDADEIGLMSESAGLACSYMDQGQDRMRSYIQNENAHLSRFPVAALTPPLSESSTPGLPSNLGYSEDMCMYQPWASLPPSSTLSDCASNEPITLMSPIYQSRLQLPRNHSTFDYLEAGPLSYGPQKRMSQPYPSMADAIHTGSSYSPSQQGCNEVVGKKTDSVAKRRGLKSRKVQIQSDKISTSTPKHFKNNHVKTESVCGHNVQPQGIESCSKTKPQTRGTRVNGLVRALRHNEPLKQHAVDVMTRWYEENIHNPYPTKAQKTAMAQEGQISENQVRKMSERKTSAL